MCSSPVVFSGDWQARDHPRTHLIESSRTSSAALAGMYATTKPSQVLNLILTLMQAPWFDHGSSSAASSSSASSAQMSSSSSASSAMSSSAPAALAASAGSPAPAAYEVIKDDSPEVLIPYRSHSQIEAEVKNPEAKKQEQQKSQGKQQEVVKALAMLSPVAKKPIAKVDSAKKSVGPE